MSKAQDFKVFSSSGWRVVETQEVAATREITRNAKEQSRLEALLDFSKSPVPDDCAHLDYLLFTPFRYPPLDYGSRFGSTFERGIFYGSMELQTAFCESACYLWLFMAGLSDLGPMKRIRDQRTAFKFEIASDHALNLRVDLSNDRDELNAICAPGNWSNSQQLGSELREEGAEIIAYPSARRPEGNNLAIFSPVAFTQNAPSEMQHWQLAIDDTSCWFGKHRESYELLKTDFLVNGKIPHHALS